MYAVIEQGGKQYKVSQGDVVEIDLVDVPADSKSIEMDKVLMISDGEDIKIGSPYLEGARVVAKFEQTARDSVVKGPKLYPMHFRRRKNSSRKIGHRQKYIQVVVDSISA